LIDYEAFCGMPVQGADTMGVAQAGDITVTELRDRIQAGLNRTQLIDVREPHEWEIVHLPGATLIPRGELPNHLNELNQTDEILVYCRSGSRSAQAVQFLRDMGFKKARNVKGGILAWA